MSKKVIAITQENAVPAVFGTDPLVEAGELVVDTKEAKTTPLGSRGVPLAQNETGLNEQLTVDTNLSNVLGQNPLFDPQTNHLMADAYPKDPPIVIKTIMGTNSHVLIPCAGYSSLTVQLSGTWAGTVNFQASLDKTNWVAFPPLTLTNVSSGAVAGTTTAAGIYRFNVSGLGMVRVLWSTSTSGALIVSYALSSAPGLTSASPLTTSNGYPYTYDSNLATSIGSTQLYSPIAFTWPVAPTAPAVQTTYVSKFNAQFPQIAARLRTEAAGDKRLPFAQDENNRMLIGYPELLVKMDELLMQQKLTNQLLMQAFNIEPPAGWEEIR